MNDLKSMQAEQTKAVEIQTRVLVAFGALIVVVSMGWFFNVTPIEPVAPATPTFTDDTNSGYMWSNSNNIALINDGERIAIVYGDGTVEISPDWTCEDVLRRMAESSWSVQ